MTAWLDYINNLNTNFDDDSPIYSSINVGTGLVLNGNLRQTQGEIQATGVKLDSVSLTTVQTGDESFVDNNTSIMTSAAIQDKIESYGYSTTTGDITGVTAGTGLSGGGTSGSVTLNVSGVTLSEIAGASIITSSESFADNDTTVMTSAAIQDKIESYGYTTATGDITGVTAGTGLSGGGASGAVTLNVSGLTVSEFAGATIQTSGESFADNDTSLMTSAAIDDRINAATPSVSDLEVSNFAASAIQTGSESFADNDTTLMTSAAIQDKITSYGYITGVTNISGNAGTATALQTARNIGGVSFDGTGNIDLPGVNTGGNQATSGNAATATALETARTIGGVSFDGTGNINLPGVNTAGSQDTSGNAATATTLATARNIAGTSFNGSANIDIDANNLSGTTLNSGVTASSLTSVGTLTGLTISTEQSTTSGVEYLLTLKSTDADDSLNLVAGAGVGVSFHTPAGDPAAASLESGRIQVVKNSNTDADDAVRMEFWTGTGSESGPERAMFIDEEKRLHILGTDDVELGASPTGILVLGDSAGNHLQIDDNEIYAKSDATTARNLHLQTNGGNVVIASGAALTAGSSDTLRMDSGDGYVDIGPMNTSGNHIYTDRIRHYFGISGNAKYVMHSSYFYPYNDNAVDLGASSYRWDDVRATNPYIQTSDSRDKKDIADVDLGLSFINDLRPVTFRWNDRSGYVGTRTHMGFVAQEVASTLGNKASDRALWTNDTAETSIDENGNEVTGVDRQGLRGGELLAPIVKAIQELSARVTTLEG